MVPLRDHPCAGLYPAARIVEAGIYIYIYTYDCGWDPESLRPYRFMVRVRFSVRLGI